jgi:O-antigen/teichoic acid export membrane protein
MHLTFKKALSANIVSSIVGLTTQAATAPLYLGLLRLDQYSQWIYIISIAAYVSLFLNGFFYALMNELTISALKGNTNRSCSIYSTGISIITCLWLSISTLIFGLWVFGATGPNGNLWLLGVGILFNVTNLASIMFDANFRSMGIYQLGTNVLTCMRAIDWAAALVLIAVTRDVPTAINFLLIYKVLTTVGMSFAIQTINKTIKFDWHYVSFRRIGDLLALGQGQMLISAATATATMGPQIVVSTFLGDQVAVMFNIYRTYLRIVTMLVTLLSSASWPILSKLYAEGKLGELEDFLARLVRSSILGASLGGVILLIVAEPVFRSLFFGKVPVDHFFMSLILLSVLSNCGITLYQSLYLATNMTSGRLLAALVASAASICFMAVAARLFGFTASLIAEVLIDLLALTFMYLGTKLTLERLREQFIV